MVWGKSFQDFFAATMKHTLAPEDLGDLAQDGLRVITSPSYAAFAASFLSAVKAAPEIYPLLHDDIVNGGSIHYVSVSFI